MKVIFIPDHPYISNIIRPSELIEARTTGDDYIESALGVNHKNPTQFQIVPFGFVGSLKPRKRGGSNIEKTSLKRLKGD